MDIECYGAVKRNWFALLLTLLILFILLLALLLAQPVEGKSFGEEKYSLYLSDVQEDVTIVPYTVRFTKQTGTPVYLKNLFHAEKGCQWAGVAGQVFGSDSSPISMLVVELNGLINGNPMYMLTLTGTAPAYGSGGFEFEFPQGPFNSQGAVGLRVYDLQGNELSETVYFDTYNDCNRNLVILNFVPASVSGVTPTPTRTPTRPTTTTTPTPTRTPSTPIMTVTPSRTSTFTRYQLQPGSPVYVSNLYHPEMGCRWMGVAGQIFSREGTPVKMLVVETGGTLNGQQVFVLGLSGNTPAYGAGGFEMMISSRPVASQRTLWVMLYDLDGRSLSDRVYFDTYNDCGRNLILINFVAVP